MPQYLEKTKASRGLRPVGEVFVMRLKGVGYIFGRVIRNDCALEPMYESRPWPRRPGLYLVYIYKHVAGVPKPTPQLRREELLIPPAMIIGAGWSHGYFSPVRLDKLTEEDVLPVHCFWSDTQRDPPIQYVDEYGNVLGRRSDPCGMWGAGSFGTIERDVAQALKLAYNES